ncbi:MAG: hypothetical protein JHD10_00505 [Sphingomonadaceae bacterium]|nr:hypothetical protein [Sphingomonadaceae bacterium]
MANNLVSTDYNPLIVAGNALSRSISSPELSSAGGGISRTILIARMLAGGSESDVAIAHLLCLPHSETFGLAIFGEPSGPTFKTHRDDRRARFDPSDAGAVGTFIDWRLAMGNTHVIASFDPSCSRELIKAIELLNHELKLPINVIFLAARDEGSPKLVDRVKQVAGKVIVARPGGRSKFEMTNDLEVPVLPRILVENYSLAQCPLRELVERLPFGSRALFQSELLKFSSKLEVMFND